MSQMNQPNTLVMVRPHDVEVADGHRIESAFLEFDDRFGRRCAVYAARCAPLDMAAGEKRSAVLHLPGGGQTVFHSDLVWWAQRGFVAYSFDWQIGAAMVHGEGRCSRWPEGVKSQGSAIEREEQAVMPLAIQAAGVVIDWAQADDRVDADRIGVTGISWGGYLTWNVCAHEPRVKAAVPVYGCGGLFAEDHVHRCRLPDELGRVWQSEWDAAAMASRMQAPVCYLSSTNDFFGYHMAADGLVSALTVAHRRSSDPNNNHHLGPGESALGVAWLRHYLDGGPAVPREPKLRADGTVDADDSDAIDRVEVWWTPSNTPDDYRCWLRSPMDRDAARLAFGRVHYRSGLTLNSPTVAVNASPRVEPLSAKQMGDVWPDARDGMASYWGLRSTQFYRTDCTVTAVPGDVTRAQWDIARSGGGVCPVSFLGLADPRWNDGKMDALEIDIDAGGEVIEHADVAVEFMLSPTVRSQQTQRLTFVPVDGRLRLKVRVEDFKGRPEWATWGRLMLLTVIWKQGGNRFILGPIRKKAAAKA